MSNSNYDGKHLTTTHRIKIEKGLLDGDSLASIARKIAKHPSTVIPGTSTPELLRFDILFRVRQSAGTRSAPFL